MQRYFLRIGFLIVVLFLSLACFSHVFASGKIKAEDFSYQKVSLGDPEANIQKQWGEPDFENTQSIWGIHLKTFTYGDIVVSTSIASGKVVDINLIGDNYQLRKNVRYGTTSSYLLNVYGKASRQFLDDRTCYIYAHPAHPHRHLILNIDSENGSLVSTRITMLPLTDEEADEMALSDDDSFVELDLNRGLISAKEIDISALPKGENAKLGGYGK